MVQQMAIYDQLIVGVPLPCPTQRINLSRQDAGWKAFRSLQQVPDTSPHQLNQESLMSSAVRAGPSIGMAIARAV